MGNQISARQKRIKSPLSQLYISPLVCGCFCYSRGIEKRKARAISRYVYTALQGGSIMHKWTNDERVMIACCNDGTRLVIFKIERIDIPENEQEKQWLEMQDFHNSVDDAHTG